MTPLKPSEKRLLTVFGIAGFLLLNLLGFTWLNKKKTAQARQRITLETRARELEVWRSRAPEAEQKREFLNRHLQAYADEATRETYLDQFVQKEADDLNLEISKNQPMPVKLEPLFHKSRYTATVTGEWDDVFEFIFRLQAPKEFRFVSSLALKSQKKEGATDEASYTVCTFEIEKWWSPESAALDEAAVEAASDPAAAETAVPPSSEQTVPPAVKPS